MQPLLGLIIPICAPAYFEHQEQLGSLLAGLLSIASMVPLRSTNGHDTENEAVIPLVVVQYVKLRDISSPIPRYIFRCERPCIFLSKAATWFCL